MAANLDALVIDKAKANALFNTAVRLEAEKKAAGAKDFNDVYGLYEEVLELDPSHERAEQHCSRLDIYRWNLHLRNLLDHARALQVEANDYEMGKYNNGVPNPGVAIEKYQEATAVYDKLINKLNAERNGERSGDAHYKADVIAMYEIVLQEKSLLPNRITGNVHYQAGLDYEATVGKEGETSYPDFILLCKKAAVEYKKAENLEHVGAGSCLARLQYHIEGKKSDAIILYKEAITEGDAAAMNELGILYEKGKVNRKIELDKAIQCYDAAIALNYTKAMLNRAALHEKNQDYVKAIELYKKASALGDVQAGQAVVKLTAELFNRVSVLSCNQQNEIYNALNLEYIKELAEGIIKLGKLYKQDGIHDGRAELKTKQMFFIKRQLSLPVSDN